MPGILFSDLDNTLVYSKGEGIAVDSRGSYTGSMHVDAWADTAGLAATGHLVPTTTRTTAEFTRMRLPDFDTAIVSNGAVVLRHGRPDPHWAGFAESSRDDAAYQALLAEVRHVAKGPSVNAIHEAEGLYLVIRGEKHIPASEGLDENVAQRAAAYGFTTTRQGVKLYLVPDWLTKEAAAAYVADIDRATIALAAGDADLDRGLLAWADHAIHPAHAVEGLPGQTTAASGIDAGPEILAWARGLLRPHR